MKILLSWSSGKDVEAVPHGDPIVPELRDGNSN